MRLAFAQSDLFPGIGIESHAIRDWMSWAPDMDDYNKKTPDQGGFRRSMMPCAINAGINIIARMNGAYTC
jgi:hypothetical protein